MQSNQWSEQRARFGSKLQTPCPAKVMTPSRSCSQSLISANPFRAGRLLVLPMATPPGDPLRRGHLLFSCPISRQLLQP